MNKLSIPLTDSCVLAIERAREVGGDAATGDHLMLAMLAGNSRITHLLDQGNADVYGLRLQLEASCAADTGSIDAIVARAVETAMAMGRPYVPDEFILYAVLEDGELQTTHFLVEHCPEVPQLVFAVLSSLGYPAIRKSRDQKQRIKSLVESHVDWSIPSNDQRRFLQELVVATAAESAIVWRAETAESVCQCPEGVPVDATRLLAFLNKNSAQSPMTFAATTEFENIAILSRFGRESEFVLEIERRSATSLVNDGMCRIIANICDAQSK